MVHLNKALIIGRVTSAGPKLTYAENGTPTVSFWLEVTELGKDGKLHTAYLPAEVVGKQAEDIAANLDPGDEICLDGKLRYKSAGVTKDGKKAGGCVVSSWYIMRQSAKTPAMNKQMDNNSTRFDIDGAGGQCQN
jgi:single-stranded DNA-binding protein